MIAFILVCSMVCGLMGSYVASQRLRGPLEGFMFGLLLGPLGILIEVLMPHGETRDEPDVLPPSPNVVSTEKWDTDTRNRFPHVRL
jgi:hypothetical protein